MADHSMYNEWSSPALAADGLEHLRHVDVVADACRAELRTIFSPPELATPVDCLQRTTDRYGRHP